MTLKKVLVHLHLFYYNQTDYFIKKLQNITNCNWDLFVTYVEENKKSIDKIKLFKPDTIFKKVENYGYDIYPFIEIIKSVNLDKYDYILKIHTKNYQKKLKLNGLKKSGYWWRNELINALLKNKKRFKENLEIFTINPEIGLICSELMLWDIGDYWPEDTYLLKKELKFLNFKSKYKKYCAGTMFLAKANIYKFLQQDNIHIEKFAPSIKTKSTGTIAHTYERILTIAVNEKGYKIYTIANKKEQIFKHIKIFIQNIFSIHNVINSGGKIKQIKILGINFYLPNKHDKKK